MEAGEHVLMAGAGAETFARRHGLEMVEPDFFSTEARATSFAGRWPPGKSPSTTTRRRGPLDETRKFGTVGAVALDRDGHLAALTSTGGMTNKRPGRIGDSP